MADLSRDIQDKMNNVAYHYAHELRLNVRSVLERPEYKDRGILVSSVRISVKKANAYEPPVIKLEFEV